MNTRLTQKFNSLRTEITNPELTPYLKASAILAISVFGVNLCGAVVSEGLKMLTASGVSEETLLFASGLISCSVGLVMCAYFVWKPAEMLMRLILANKNTKRENCEHGNKMDIKTV